MKPLLWMRVVRAAELPSARLAALLCLALRMREDGSGYASERQLADDAKVTGRTVRRATRWAIEAGILNRTQRGHRRGDGSASASQWLLIDPASIGQQGPVETPVDNVSTGHQGPIERSLNRTGGPSQPDTRTAQEVYIQEGSGPSHREPQGPAQLAADERRDCVDCGAPWPRSRRVPPDGLCAQCRRERSTQLRRADANEDEGDEKRRSGRAHPTTNDGSEKLKTSPPPA